MIVPTRTRRHEQNIQSDGHSVLMIALPRGMTSTKEIAMPVIVVTRLRLRDPALLDEFFTDAVAAIEQAQ
jgi:hypothetical protein